VYEDIGRLIIGIDSQGHAVSISLHLARVAPGTHFYKWNADEVLFTWHFFHGRSRRKNDASIVNEWIVGLHNNSKVFVAAWKDCFGEPRTERRLSLRYNDSSKRLLLAKTIINHGIWISRFLRTDRGLSLPPYELQGHAVPVLCAWTAETANDEKSAIAEYWSEIQLETLADKITMFDCWEEMALHLLASRWNLGTPPIASSEHLKYVISSYDRDKKAEHGKSEGSEMEENETEGTETEGTEMETLRLQAVPLADALERMNKLNEKTTSPEYNERGSLMTRLDYPLWIRLLKKDATDTEKA
jgi:hypothetical protein